MIAVFILAAATGSAGLVGPASAGQAPSAAQPEASVVENAIEALYRKLSGPWRKPAPVWILDSATGVYRAVQQYRNGGKVSEAVRVAHAARAEVDAVKTGLDEVKRIGLATLKELAILKELIEEGRELTDREYRLVRDLLDAQAGRLDAIVGRVGDLERFTAEHTARMRALEARAAEAEANLAAVRAQAIYWQGRTRDVEAEVAELQGESNGLAEIVRRQNMMIEQHRRVVGRRGCGAGRYYSYKAKGCIEVAQRR